MQSTPLRKCIYVSRIKRDSKSERERENVQQLGEMKLKFLSVKKRKKKISFEEKKKSN